MIGSARGEDVFSTIPITYDLLCTPPYTAAVHLLSLLDLIVWPVDLWLREDRPVSRTRSGESGEDLDLNRCLRQTQTKRSSDV
ncbi:unnamed protein product [Peniophora sp. CBMAI 1063]|nr:unnamed protein product [Peniophora sp. CBMAI 1063]